MEKERSYTHQPVLLEEIIDYLNCSSGKIYLDCTLGEGGHTERILEESAPLGKVIGIDQDEQILQVAAARLSKFGPRFQLVRDNFKNIKTILSELQITKVDGCLMDLGVSSFHFQSQNRGFSFQIDAPLDMRLDQRTHLTAAQVINKSTESEIGNILHHFGQETWSRKIARSICNYRKKKEFKRPNN